MKLSSEVNVSVIGGGEVRVSVTCGVSVELAMQSPGFRPSVVGPAKVLRCCTPFSLEWYGQRGIGSTI